MGKRAKTKEPGIAGWAVAAAAAWLVIHIFYSVYGVHWRNFLDPPALDSWRIVPSVWGLHLLRLLGCAWICLVLAGTGRWVLRRLGAGLRGPWEEGALSFALGYGLWATGLLLLGLGRLWYRPLLIGLLTVATFPAALELRSFIRDRMPGGYSWPELRPQTPLAWVAAAFFLAGWLLHLPHSLIPETFYDALSYHLGMPNLYLIRHGILPTPEHSYSGIPSVPSMLYGLSIALDPSGIMAQLLHNVTMLGIAAGLMGLASRLNRPQAGPVACAVFALTPVVTSESFRTSVGLEWALLQLMCFHAFLAAAEESPGSAARRAWILLCGSFMGLAMGTKYPAWLLPAVVLGGMLYVRRAAAAEPKGEACAHPFSHREALVLLGVGALWVAPWILKNLAFYGNPLFPFFHERLAPDALHRPDWNYISQGGLDLKGKLLTAAGLKRWLLHPWVFSRHAWEFGGAIGPAYLGLLPLLLMASQPWSIRLLGLMLALGWLPLSLASSITRFFIPFLAPWSLLAAAGLAGLPRAKGRGLLTALGCVAFVSIGAGYWAMNMSSWKNLDVLLGGRSFEDYRMHTNVASHYATPPHAGFEHLHQKAPRDARVLIFGDARHFPLRLDHIVSSPDQASALEVWANASRSGVELRERFRREGIRYILVNHGEIFRLRTPIDFTVAGLKSFGEFWKRYTLKEFQSKANRDHWVVVYRILDEDEAARPHPVDELFAGYKADFM